MNKIARNFDAAALYYDKAASVQAQVASHLVRWAQPPAPPADVLDAGSGTGFAASAVLGRWPDTAVTALDHAPAMLRQAQRKIPGLHVIAGDAAQTPLAHRFDAIFSSMALHWLPEPQQVLRRWQGWLKPEGRLYVALLVEGSFREWRDLCVAADLKDGLWDMPRADFAGERALRTERQTISISYPSALEFLCRLKATGAATPRAGHMPFSVSAMRELLRQAPRPFAVSYEVLYIELASSPSI